MLKVTVIKIARALACLSVARTLISLGVTVHRICWSAREIVGFIERASKKALLVKAMRDNRDCDHISVLKIEHNRDIPGAVKNGLGSIADFNLSPDSSVVIKPNLCAIKTPETGATTDVKVVEAIVNELKKRFGVSNISIIESDGTQVLADMAFKLLGYERASSKLNVKLVNLSKAPFSEREFPDNVFIKKLKVPSIIEDADLFISVPKIKIHSDCVFTGVLKNQYGCNPYPRKTIYHKRLDDAIVDFNSIFRPDIIVVDGIVGMEGYKGPTDGVPIRMNTLIFGRDAVAVDHLICRLIGIDPNRVQYLIEAERRGIGKTNYKTIGANLDKVKVKFRCSLPKWHNLYGLFH